MVPRRHPGFDRYPPVPPRRDDHDVGRDSHAAATEHLPPTRAPRKLTVTRVLALRSRELTARGFATFQRAAKADGADESGLTALTYTVMTSFACDAAVAVALANTLFFSAATAESKEKVALYLLITIAPFALIAPLIGPMLDRIQHGRRLALATSFLLRGGLAGLLIFNFNSWMLYPAALGLLVFSKSFYVLKSAVTPRVVPPTIDLVRTNSRLTVFGLVFGTIVGGGIAAALTGLFKTNGPLWFVVALGVAGAYLSLRIPSWVEVTEGEVPATLTYHGSNSRTEVIERDAPTLELPGGKPAKRRQPLGRAVVTGLWGNSAVKLLTGFLTLYIAFVAKAQTHNDAIQQAAMLGAVGAAAGVGNFAGNATGARLSLGRPALIVLRCTAAVTIVTVVAAILGNLLGAVICALVNAGAAALAKVSLDAAIQDDLPQESVASAFGRSESVLQLSWVFGGALGLLLPTDYWIGFGVVAAILGLLFAQTFVSYRGHSLLPGLGGNRPVHAAQEVPRR
ncbi:MAG: MFS transporter [Mycobacteriaceae bacterium]|nr:MFS transporter [Mycobacteriaceae bacterium]